MSASDAERPCPECALQLEAAALRGRAIETCPAGHGLWFPAALLEQLMLGIPVRSKTAPARFREDAVAVTTPTAMTCPGDDTPLRRALWGDATFARCPRCRGHWLDAAALRLIADEVAGERLVDKVSDPEDSTALAILGALLGP